MALLFHIFIVVKQQTCTGGLTSMRWELTFLPFLLQLTFGLGSPVAWHTNETTPPETPIWSTGTLVNRGGTGERTDKEKDIKSWQEEKSLLLIRRSDPEGPPYCRDPVEFDHDASSRSTLATTTTIEFTRCLLLMS